MTEADPSAAAPAPADFIRDIVAQHVAEKRYPKIVTRFPPEPNGYLHIGHAKSICLNFGIARENAGQCNLRMDDTNPAKEDVEYVDSIITDVRWLIAGWADQCMGFKPKGAHPGRTERDGKLDFHLGPISPDAPNAEPFFASDNFDALYEFAVRLITKGKAYVCDLTPEETDTGNTQSDADAHSYGNAVAHADLKPDSSAEWWSGLRSHGRWQVLLHFQ